MIYSFFFTFTGIFLLYYGAELLVRGSVGISRRWKISPFLTGLIVIGLGTSSPELVVSLEAVLMGNSEIALGNILGSNISNLALILGIAALISPVAIDKDIYLKEVPVLILVSMLTTALAWNGELSRAEGLVLLAGLALYIFILFRRKQTVQQQPVSSGKTGSRTFLAIATAGGLLLLLAGAHLMILGSLDIGKRWGINEGIVGLTLVAVGTSLPELATAVVAGIRKQGSLIFGALIGSNILNLLLVLGVTAMVKPIRLSDLILTDFLLMCLAALIMIPMIRSNNSVGRTEGIFLLLFYTGYLFFLFLR